MDYSTCSDHNDAIKKHDEATLEWGVNNVLRALKLYEELLPENPYDGHALLMAAMLAFLNKDKQKGRLYCQNILSVNDRDESALELIEIGDRLISGSISVKRTPHCIIFSDQKNDKLIEQVAHAVERNYEKIYDDTKRKTKCITIEINETYYPVPRTRFLFRPISPKIEIDPQNCTDGNLIHELTHAMFPSEHLLTLEGLALFYTDKLANEESWPFNIKGYENIPFEDHILDDLIQDYMFDAAHFTNEHLMSGKSLEYYKAAFYFVHELIKQKGFEFFLDIYDKLSVPREVDPYEMFVLAAGHPPHFFSPDHTNHKEFNDNDHQELKNRFLQLKKMGVSKEEWLRFIQEIEKQKGVYDNYAQLFFIVKSKFQYIKTIRNELEEGLVDEKCHGLFIEDLAALILQLKQLIKKNYNEPQLHQLLGEAYALQIKDKPISEKMSLLMLSQSELNKALAMDPENPDVYLSAGRVILFTPKVLGGGTQKAKEFFDKAIAFDPNSDEAYAWYAKIAFMEKKIEQSMDYCNKAIELNPNNPLAKKMLLSLLA